VRMEVTADRLTVSVTDDGRGGVSLAGSRGLRGPSREDDAGSGGSA
jgi:signal transduction histidine kinase